MLTAIPWFLWTFGLLNIGYWVHLNLKAARSQSRGARELERPGLGDSLSPSNGDIVGRLDIPRLSLSTVVFEGADQNVLAPCATSGRAMWSRSTRRLEIACTS
jgi:hypothetical protein